jgi:hypothetical protein
VQYIYSTGMSAVINVNPGSHGPISKVTGTSLNSEEPRVIKRRNENFHFLLAALCTEGCRAQASSFWKFSMEV